MERLADIFERQSGHQREFRPIQQRNGVIGPGQPPVDPFTYLGTAELHLAVHWINLELFEVINERDPEKRKEEIADVLHFVVDLALLLGFGPELVPLPPEGEGDRLLTLVNASRGDPLVFPDADTNARFCMLAALGVADLLKNKPWKQKIRTDLNWAILQSRTSSVFYWFGSIARAAGMTDDDLYAAYCAKSDKNHQRVVEGV